MTSVDRQDVKEWAKEDAPIVQVRGTERGPEENPSSVPSGKPTSRSSEGEAHVHEGDNIRSSYDVEEDVSPSLFQKLKGTFLGVSENKDPNPTQTSEGSGMLSNLQHSLFGTKEQIKSAETISSEEVGAGLKKPVDSSVQSDEKRGQLSSDELGTGYEEDTERSGLSSDGSTDFSDKESSSSQDQSFFKPVKENSSELTLEDLRATKTNKVSSPDEIKAPGMLGRAKEELEAVTEAAMEGLNLSDKRAKSGDQLESVNQGGFFSRMAEKIGYGGHERSQSQ